VTGRKTGGHHGEGNKRESTRSGLDAELSWSKRTSDTKTREAKGPIGERERGKNGSDHVRGKTARLQLKREKKKAGMKERKGELEITLPH